MLLTLGLQQKSFPNVSNSSSIMKSCNLQIGPYVFNNLPQTLTILGGGWVRPNSRLFFEPSPNKIIQTCRMSCYSYKIAEQRNTTSLDKEEQQ